MHWENDADGIKTKKRKSLLNSNMLILAYI